MSDLIVLRGNSAAGKSALALELQRVLGPGTANVGQDHFRRVVLREHDVPDGDNISFIADAVTSCLRLGYTTILEGILYSPHYGAMLRTLLADHAGPAHVFYLDVPLDETLRRHELKPLTVPAAKLREWYHHLDLLDVDGEIVIDGSPDLQEVLAVVLARIGPVTPPTHARTPERFV